MDKERKKGGKLRKIASGIVSLAVIIILFKACTGSFDQAASDATNGAYGSGNHSPKELSRYLSYTEEELVKALGVEKNDLGYYPDDTEANFICMDGKVYSAMINQNHKKDTEYMLFGIALGQDSGKVSQKLGEDFELLDSSDAVGGTRDTYMNKKTRHLLAVDYDPQSVVTAVSCVVGDNSETEKVTDSSMDEIVEWLDSIGAYDKTMKDWEAEYILNFYNSIREDMKSWDAENDFNSLREHLKGFDPNHTSEEIDNMTDYQVYVESKNLRESMVVDAEEPDWEEEYVYEATSVQEFKEFIRDDANIGNTIIFPGVVFSSNNGFYKYAVSIEAGLFCYISDPGFNLLNNDVVKVTAIYRGKNNAGYICFETISAEIQ